MFGAAVVGQLDRGLKALDGRLASIGHDLARLAVGASEGASSFPAMLEGKFTAPAAMAGPQVVGRFSVPAGFALLVLDLAVQLGPGYSDDYWHASAGISYSLRLDDVTMPGLGSLVTPWGFIGDRRPCRVVCGARVFSVWCWNRHPIEDILIRAQASGRVYRATAGGVS